MHIVLIEIESSDMSAFRRPEQEWLESVARRSALRRATYCEDASRPGHYVAIYEYDSREAAEGDLAANETQEKMNRFSSVSKQPPTRRHLDVNSVVLPSRPERVEILELRTPPPDIANL